MYISVQYVQITEYRTVTISFGLYLAAMFLSKNIYYIPNTLQTYFISLFFFDLLLASLHSHCGQVLMP